MIVKPKFGKADALLSDYLKNNSYSKVFILTDNNTREHCLPLIQNNLPKGAEFINILPGEHQKHIQTCVSIWESLTSAKADRNALLVNLGGGVISDMGGFCAATYKRGIDFINFPTTLLSQVDAGIGGKLGIDFNLYKNHIGLFKEPKSILVDIEFLETLPARQLRSGFAEIIKHTLIKSADQWKKLKNGTFPNYPWEDIIQESVEIKSEIVRNDFKETGERKLLNFGHTIGHAVESYLLSKNTEIYHGEAVAAGIIMESYISCKYGALSESSLEEIITFINNVYDKVKWNRSDEDSIFELMKQDKKNKNNTILMTAINSIGDGIYDFEINEEVAFDALHFYREN